MFVLALRQISRTGKAVARNRSKRRLRALASLYPIKKPVDIVVIATPLTPTCSFQELSYDFSKIRT